MNAKLFANMMGLIVLFGLFTPITYAQYFVPQSQIEDFGNSLGAAPTIPRQLLPIAIDLIKEFEGWRPVAYDDPIGLCTIGYGHLIALKRCRQADLGQFSKALTPAEGLILLELDTRSSRSAVRALAKRELTESQFSALSSFAFNVGKANFASSTLLKHVNSNQDRFAIKEFARWVKANGQIFKGLQDRRSCEAALYAGALQGNKQGRFSRDECAASLGGATSTLELLDIAQGEKK